MADEVTRPVVLSHTLQGAIYEDGVHRDLQGNVIEPGLDADTKAQLIEATQPKVQRTFPSEADLFKLAQGKKK